MPLQWWSVTISCPKKMSKSYTPITSHFHLRISQSFIYSVLKSQKKKANFSKEFRITEFLQWFAFIDMFTSFEYLFLLLYSCFFLSFASFFFCKENNHPYAFDYLHNAV